MSFDFHLVISGVYREEASQEFGTIYPTANSVNDVLKMSLVRQNNGLSLLKLYTGRKLNVMCFSNAFE